MVFDTPTLCAEAAIAAARQTGKRRVLVSGSLSPDHFKLITALLTAEGLDLNDPDPDPLGFEDLVSQVSPDMAGVIFQNPGYFGTLRDLTALSSECREWDVPLLLLTPPGPRTQSPATQNLAAALRRIPGIRLITDEFIDRFSLYLGHDQDAGAVLDSLSAQGIQGCEAAPLAYPQYPELRPVLIVNAPQAAEPLVTALRQALLPR